jgi:rhamnosyltransferase
MNNVGGVIVSFNGASSLVETVNAVRKQVDILVIVDNGSNPETMATLKIIESDGLSIIWLEKNYGIAYALNRGVEKLISHGVKWVITFDQDSLPHENMIENMVGFINTNKNTYENIMSVSPRILYDDSKITNLNEDSYGICSTVITSGNMVNIKVFKEIGFYDEDLFIDSVDFDFCLRIRLAGYLIFRVDSAILNHNLGTSVKHTVAGMSFNTYSHSSLRRYYMIRNHLYLQKKYLSCFPLFFLKKNLFILLLFIQILLLESDKISNIKMLFIGIKHYLEGVKNQFVQP